MADSVFVWTAGDVLGFGMLFALGLALLAYGIYRAVLGLTCGMAGHRWPERRRYDTLDASLDARWSRVTCERCGVER
jgi:hypothetical protein